MTALLSENYLHMTQVTIGTKDNKDILESLSKRLDFVEIFEREIADEPYISAVVKQEISAVKSLLETELSGYYGYVWPRAISNVKLIAFDVDSTIVDGEVINMLAQYKGCEQEVAEITQKAMEGKLDFAEALRERVKLLAGTPRSVFDEIYENLTLMPGVHELMDTLHGAGIKTMMVSGGFTPITNLLAKDLDMSFSHANDLEIVDDTITGQVDGSIVDAQAKSFYLQKHCEDLKIDLHDTMAVGDGANDILMAKTAGYSVAYCAKKALEENADTSLRIKNLGLIAAIAGVV